WVSRSTRATVTPARSSILASGVKASTVSPDQPNHRPSYFRRAADSAMARPPADPAAGSLGAETRLETTISRLMAWPSVRTGEEGSSSGRSSRVGPRTAQQDGAVDDADQRVGLRIIAPQFVVLQRYVLRQQPGLRPAAQHFGEDLPRLLDPAVLVQGFDEPEGAEVERRLRLAEIVRLDVAEQIGALLQVAFDRLEGPDLARVERIEEAEVGQLQQRGVQLAVPEAGGEPPLVRQEGLGLDPFPDRGRAAAPQPLPVGQAQMGRGLGQPVAGGPAHHRRIGM